MKYIGFVRPTHRHTLARQEWQMREYDLDEVIADNLDEAIQMIREGRALVVAEASVLGKSGMQIADAVRQVHERGGYVVDAEKAIDSRNPADAVVMGASPRGRRKLTSQEASQRAQKYTDADLAKAKKLWARKTLTTEEVSKRTGIAIATLWRRLGPRGLKAGRRPAKKKR